MFTRERDDLGSHFLFSVPPSIRKHVNNFTKDVSRIDMHVVNALFVR